MHANLLDGLINGEFPYTPDLAPKLISLLMLVIGLLFAFVLAYFGPLKIILSTMGLLVSYLGLNFYFWHQHLINLPMTLPLLMIFVLGVMHLMSGFFIEGWSKREISTMFGQYVPKAHIDKMLNTKDAYGFDGENKQLTVLFSDIRSFTTISESLSATDLKGMLNSFFTPITEIIFNHQGTIDKYVGDMVMAFWGAPIDDPHHAKNALLAALNMLKKVDELKPIFKEKGYPEVEVGIGINSGPMNVGDMGSSFRRSYTVLGDAVNLGSRLESLTKFYGVRLLVGPQTNAACDEVVLRFVDRIIVKGKDEPVMVYEPLGLAEDVLPSQMEELEQFEQAYRFYLQQNWSKAQLAFVQLIKISSSEKLYQVYLTRIEVLRRQILPANWDGTFRHTEK